MRRKYYTENQSIDALYRPEGRDMTLVLPSLWAAFRIGYRDGIDSRDAEVESLQHLVDDLYMVAYNDDVKDMTDLLRLRGRRMVDQLEGAA